MPRLNISNLPAAYQALLKRPSKYRAQRVEVDGIKFDSKREARRYGELKLMERAGEIAELRLQPPLKYLSDDDSRVLFTYKGDFRYLRRVGKLELAEVIEDVKGVRTPLYKLKKKLIEDRFGITIEEV